MYKVIPIDSNVLLGDNKFYVYDTKDGVCDCVFGRDILLLKTANYSSNVNIPTRIINRCLVSSDTNIVIDNELICCRHGTITYVWYKGYGVRKVGAFTFLSVHTLDPLACSCGYFMLEPKRLSFEDMMCKMVLDNI